MRRPLIFRLCLVAALAFLCVESHLFAQTPTTSPAARVPTLADIRAQLGNDDFAVRAAAQRQLDNIPVDQLEALRAAAREERDLEVKTRLAGRIADMELFILLHPKPVSVNLQDVPPIDVLTELNNQMDGSYFANVTFGGDRRITLKAAGSFWDVMRQLNDAVPFQATAVTTSTAAGITPILRLTELPVNAAQLPMTVSDGFAIVPQVLAAGGGENWGLRVRIFADPRIRIVRYSSAIQLEQAIMQDGRRLLPTSENTALANLSRPTFGVQSTVVFPVVNGLASMKEFKGHVKLEIVEREKVMKVKLNEAPEHVPMPFGKLEFSRDAGGVVTVRAVPANDDEEGDVLVSPLISPIVGGMQVRAFTASGKLTNTLNATSPRIQTTVQSPDPTDPVTTLEVSYIESTRQMALPIRLVDIPVP